MLVMITMMIYLKLIWGDSKDIILDNLESRWKKLIPNSNL